MTKPRVHILLGAPGSGKGTAAKQIVQEFGLSHLSTGDILRDAVSKGTEVGLRAKAIMAAGKLVDDSTVNSLVFARLQEETGDVLFDGYPRTREQAESLEEFLSLQGIELGLVMEIDVPQDVLEARVVGRRVCSNSACGAIFHLSSLPPQREGVCDKCSSPLKHRADDTSDAFRSRMAEFNQTYRPVKAFYQGKPNFHQVDGNRPPVPVFHDLAKLF